MKKHGFIYILLIATLCFSQLAATVHVAGHLGPPSEDRHRHTVLSKGPVHQHPHHYSRVQYSPGHPSHAAHREWRPAFATLHTVTTPHSHPGADHFAELNSGHDTALASHHKSDHDQREAPARHGLFGSDCAAYHAFVGLSFCLFGSADDYAVAAVCPRFTPLQSRRTTGEDCPGLPIRAPPVPV